MDKIRNIKVLILEDDLETVRIILEILRSLEKETFSFAATVLPDYIQTEEFINKNPHVKFDILLLNRDCFLGGSFHNVNLKNFDLDKVISISSVPEYNDKAKEMGVRNVVLKDYTALDKFAVELKAKISSVL